jgi:hypothetical protein
MLTRRENRHGTIPLRVRATGLLKSVRPSSVAGAKALSRILPTRTRLVLVDAVTACRGPRVSRNTILHNPHSSTGALERLFYSLQPILEQEARPDGGYKDLGR